jgi:hypothetical protein
MQIIFVLDKDAHTEEIERGLHLISGISWGFVGNNLSIHVPENLLDSLEERILSAVARGVAPAPNRVSGAIEDLESSALCGALQAELLDRYLPIAIEKMTKDVVVIVDSIDEEHSMLRIRGPRPKGIGIGDRQDQLMDHVKLCRWSTSHALVASPAALAKSSSVTSK